MSKKKSSSHILKKTKSGKYRLVKVKTILPSDNVREILINSSVNSHLVKDHVSNESLDIRKNSDDNTSLIQRDITRVESVIEKILYISIVSLVISCLTLCIS